MDEGKIFIFDFFFKFFFQIRNQAVVFFNRDYAPRILQKRGGKYALARTDLNHNVAPVTFAARTMSPTTASEVRKFCPNDFLLSYIGRTYV